jgi:metalloendopeptidase OMA1, mitochondrial
MVRLQPEHACLARAAAQLEAIMDSNTLRHTAISSLVALALLPNVTGCTKVPVTGRTAFNLVSDEQGAALGEEAYQQILSQSRVVRSGKDRDRVLRVARKIADAANEPDFDWQFALIDDSKQANAFCLPGGKVGVYTGILPVTRDDNGLAVVVAHEVAHAIARHGTERMSDDLALQIAGSGLQELLSNKSPATRNVAMAAFGLGAQFGVMLPFSRSHESEADRIGLVLMARAGYDPAEAIEFWRRMAAQSEGSNPPEFLSTHPSDETRIRNLEKWLPEARSAARGG